MTLEQCKRLKEMGFPRSEGEWFYDSDGEFLPNPTAEEALEWVAGKLTRKEVESINIIFSYGRYEIKTTGNFIFPQIITYETLSDGVFDLIMCMHKNNKLLEGK